MGVVFFSYLSAMVRQAIESTARMDLAGALILAVLIVAVGIGLLPFSANDLLNIGFWIAVGLVVWFVVLVLVITPARVWESSQKALDEAKKALENSQSPSVVNNYYTFIYPVPDKDEGDTKSASGSTTVSPEEPQSLE